MDKYDMCCVIKNTMRTRSSNMQQPLRGTRRKVDNRTAEGEQGEQAKQYIYIYDSSDSSEEESRIGPNGRPASRKASTQYVANPVYSSKEESRIRPNGRPGSRKANRRYGSEEESRIKKKRRANKSDELKLKCYAIRIALLSEYIRVNRLMVKQEITAAWKQHGWSFTIMNPKGNVETIMADDVFDTKVQRIPRLKRAHTLLTNLQNLVRHKTSWSGFDLEMALPTRNEACKELQQELYDCINVDLRKIHDSSDSDTDDEQHASVMNCGPPTGKQRRPPVRYSLYPNLEDMVATDRMYGTLEEWLAGDQMALLSIECVNCSNTTETPPCCLRCTAQYLGLTIKQTPLGCGLFATRNFEIGDVIVPYLGLVSPDRPVQSAYTVQVSKKRYIDATLLRGLGSFVNHSDFPSSNVIACLATFQANHFSRVQRDDGRTLMNRKSEHSFPSVLQMDPFVGFQHYWLVARKRIDKDTELKIDYGTEAGAINNLMHKTLPPFCMP